jgi:hypothetical protein
MEFAEIRKEQNNTIVMSEAILVGTFNAWLRGEFE